MGMEFIIIWFLCGVAAAVIGSRKGAGCSGFFLGLLFGPFGIIIALAMKGDRIRCPLCKELIHKKAVICPHCRSNLLETIPAASFIEQMTFEIVSTGDRVRSWFQKK
jgi:hypothetical protein